MTCMKTPTLSRLACGLFMLGLCSAPVQSADSARVGAYDFSYLLSGDARAKPVQVFDDGRNTYFQFRAGEAVPAIFSARSGVTQLVVPTQEGPYVKVPEVHGRFVLQVGRAQANVIHGAGERADAPQISAMAPNGMSTPYVGEGSLPAGGRLVASLAPVAMNLGNEQALDRNSYATPVKGDRVYWPERSEAVEHSFGFSRGGYVLSREARRALGSMAQRAAPSARFTVIGRDDDSYKEGLERARADALRDALTKAGIASERITVRTGVAQPSRKGKLWESTVVVESQSEAPRLQLATTDAGSSSRASNPAIASNIEALVRSGVLNRAQAAAILTRHQATSQAAGTAAAEAPAGGVAQVPEGGFTLTVADKTISGAVRRWAKALSYQVVWDASAQLDAPIAGDGRIEGQNISDAMDQLVRGLKEKGYVLEVTIYANRVIRFSTPTATAPKKGPEWQMLPGDRTVAGTLGRWAGDARWRVEWAAKDEVPVTGKAVVKQSDFKAAADFVMQQVAAAGYRLRATTRPDNTLVVSSY